MSRTLRRRTEITIETHRTTTIWAKKTRFVEHCEHCRETVTAFPPEELALFLRLDPTEVCRRIGLGELHLIKDGRTVALVCGNSEKKEIQTNQ